MSTRQRSRQTAHLMEYLVHEAWQRTRAEGITIQCENEDGRIGVMFPTGRLEALPAEPSKQYRPPGWSTANATLVPSETGPNLTYWNWEPERDHWAPEVGKYVGELLRFIEPAVRSTNHLSTLGGKDPLTHCAAGFEEKIDDRITVVLTEERLAAEMSWLQSEYRAEGAWGNVIHPGGVARYAGRIAARGAWKGWIGTLAEDEARAPARRAELDCRVVIEGKPNRNRLRYVNTSGLTEEQTAAAVAASQRLVIRWAEQRREEGWAISGGRETSGHTIVMHGTPEAYGERMPIVARRTIEIMTDGLNSELLPAIKHAMMMNSELTPVDSWEGHAQSKARVLRMAYTDHEGQETEIPLDDAIVERGRRTDIGLPPARNVISAYADLEIDDPDQSIERTRLELPALVINLGELHRPMLVVADSMREMLDVDGLVNLQAECNRGLREEWGRLQAEMALNGWSAAFRHEVKRILKQHPPGVGYPDSAMKAQFGPDGITFEEEGAAA